MASVDRIVWRRCRSEDILKDYPKSKYCATRRQLRILPHIHDDLSDGCHARKPSLPDLTADQWALLPPLIPPAKAGGRPREVPRRAVIHTLLSRNQTGGQGDMLPPDVQPQSTVDEYCSLWRHDSAMHLRLKRLEPSHVDPPCRDRVAA